MLGIPLEPHQQARSEARAAKRQGRAGEETPLPDTPQFRIDSILQSYSKDFILWAEDPEHPGRPNPAISRYDFRAGETHPHKVALPKDPSDQKGLKRFQEHELRVQKFLKAVQRIRDRAAEILLEADRINEEAFKTNDITGWEKAAELREKAEAMKRRGEAFGRSTTVIVVHAPTYLFSGENRDGVYHVGRRSVAYFPARYIDSLRLDRPGDMEKLAFFLDRAQRRVEPLEKGLKEVEAGTLPSKDVMKYVPESFEADDRLFIRDGDFTPVFRQLDIFSKRDAVEKSEREKEIERLQKGISRIEEIFNRISGKSPQKSYLPRLARWFDRLLHAYSAEGMQSPDSRFDLFNQSEILNTMLGHVERNENLPTRDELDMLARLYGILAHLQENVGQHENALRSYRAQIDVWKEIQRGPDTAPYPLQLQEQVIRAFLKLGLYDDFLRELNVYLTGHGFPRKLYRLDREFLAHSFILSPAFEAELTAILDSQLEFSARSGKHTPEFEQRIMKLKEEMAEGFKEAREKIKNGTWETETTELFHEEPKHYTVSTTAEGITLSIEVDAATITGKGAFHIAGFSSRELTPRDEFHFLGERIRGYFRTELFSKDKSNILKLIITPGKIRIQEAGIEAFWF
ncbi:MAG TPA: hypothetical protein VJC08_01215, partial [bacterium]|nr:hypothetical protein [bacterium]